MIELLGKGKKNLHAFEKAQFFFKKCPLIFSIFHIDPPRCTLLSKWRKCGPLRLVTFGLGQGDVYPDSENKNVELKPPSIKVAPFL
jgi:hypothetical protein